MGGDCTLGHLLLNCVVRVVSHNNSLETCVVALNDYFNTLESSQWCILISMESLYTIFIFYSRL